MNNPDHISECIETTFGVKILKFYDTDPGSGMGKNQIREWGKFGSGMEKFGSEMEKIGTRNGKNAEPG
jgi:hypothetical protein